MKILLVIFIIAALTVFCLAETTALENITNEAIILRAVLPHHVEPLSRIVNPPTLWDIIVGYQIYWQTSFPDNLEVAADYDLKKNGNLIELFHFMRKNLYPNTLLKEELHAGTFPGGNTYTGEVNIKCFFPGNHTPTLELGYTKSIQPPR